MLQNLETPLAYLSVLSVCLHILARVLKLHPLLTG